LIKAIELELKPGSPCARGGEGERETCSSVAPRRAHCDDGWWFSSGRTHTTTLTTTHSEMTQQSCCHTTSQPWPARSHARSGWRIGATRGKNASRHVSLIMGMGRALSPFVSSLLSPSEMVMYDSPSSSTSNDAVRGPFPLLPRSIAAISLTRTTSTQCRRCSDRQPSMPRPMANSTICG
jgi:hypothetical protein